LPDYSKILAVIAASTDADQLRNFEKNARTKGVKVIEEAAFSRLLSILTDSVPNRPPHSLERDFWTMIHAFEEILRAERGRTVRMTRTRQKVARVGVVQILIDFATAATPTDGFDTLIERHRPDLTGEALVLRHASLFEPAVVAAASARLESVGVDLLALPASALEPATSE
jgi:hypothetical protein